jgi:hypothetical protein
LTRSVSLLIVERDSRERVQLNATVTPTHPQSTLTSQAIPVSVTALLYQVGTSSTYRLSMGFSVLITLNAKATGTSHKPLTSNVRHNVTLATILMLTRFASGSVTPLARPAQELQPLIVSLVILGGTTNRQPRNVFSVIQNVSLVMVPQMVTVSLAPPF